MLTPEQEKEKWRKIVVAAHYLSENGEVKKKALANAVGVTPRDMTFLLEPMAQAGVLVYERAAYVGALNAECWLDENEQDEEVRRVREKKTT